jgi:hypothetical protein
LSSDRLAGVSAHIDEVFIFFDTWTLPVPGEQQKVMNIYDHSTDSMHFLRREQRDFIEVEYVLFPAHRPKSLVGGSAVKNGTGYWHLALLLSQCRTATVCSLIDLTRPYSAFCTFIFSRTGRIRLELLRSRGIALY